ncbi:MAG: hypothetical protein JXR75_13530, partial [Rhodobacteraceae bacterium]|nr:hypothetical protein [Paracoccaceae bacterium]
MSSSEIRIEGKPVYFFGDTGQDHLYLVLAEADGTERVLRAGPAGTFGTGPIRFEISVPMLGSADGRLFEDRDRYGSRVLDLGGRTAEDVWDIMLQQARIIDQAAVPFQLYSENSNSSIGSLLHVVGIDVAQVLPDQPNRNDSYPGLGSILDRLAVDLQGGVGNDIVLGGRASDRLAGADGADTLGGGAGADQISGGAGDDFLNGGWGPDRVLGGAGADSFYHAGRPGHGSDWIDDYRVMEGDRLVYGGTARPDQFQINLARTPGAGSDLIDEAFVIWRPTGQILWALTDGAAQSQIVLTLASGPINLFPPPRQDSPVALTQIMAQTVNPAFPSGIVLKEAENMATAYLNSQFFNFVSQITTASDPVQALLGTSLDNMAAFEGLGDALDGEWLATSMTSSQVVLTQADVTLTFSGAGLGPLTNADDFLSGIFGGATTGTLTGISLRQGGTELLGLTLSASSLRVTSGDQSLELTGVLPTTFATLPELLGLASVLDLEALAALDAAERAALVAQLTPYSLTGLSVRDGATTVASLSLGVNEVYLQTPTLVLEISSGSLPANLGELAQQIFDAAGPGDTDVIFLLLEALEVSEITLTTTTGVELLRLEGALDGSEPLQIVLDGVAVPTGVPLLFNLTDLGTTLTATDVDSLLIGTAGIDSLTGGIGNDTMFGLDGADRLNGAAGSDRLNGDDGSDTLDGGLGDDFLFGGATEADLRDVIYGGGGNDSIDGGWGNDSLLG